MRQPRRDQEGSAMIIATLILFMLGVLATVVASTSVTRSRVAVESRFRTEAMSAAEARLTSRKGAKSAMRRALPLKRSSVLACSVSGKTGG